jgi:energy-coupling factor transport system substrate-specific component
MRELIACWKHTRLIVLIGLCGALYVAVLLPFKIAVIIPGITEIRPGAALPIVFSIFFGPAAAWGAAFGNTIGDMLGGTISPATFFGFFGNFIYAFVPYRVLRNYFSSEGPKFTAKKWAVFFLSLFLACGLCATIIALGADFLGMVPFSFLVQVIFLNNFIVSLILAPILIPLLQKRVHQIGLTWTKILQPHEISDPLLKSVGPVILFVLLLLFYAAGMRWLPIFSALPKIAELLASLLLTLCAVILI